MAERDIKKIEYSLTIEGKYHNALDIEGFSYMMKDPSYCYKFYWLEAIVQLISEGVCPSFPTHQLPIYQHSGEKNQRKSKEERIMTV